MARQANGTIQLTSTGNITNVLTGGENDPVAGWGSVMSAITLANGVLEDQINRALYNPTVDIASAADLVLDLYDFAGFDSGGGDGKDLLGQDMALDQIVGIIVIVAAGSDGGLTIGNDGTTATFNSLFDGHDDGVIGPLKASALNPGIFMYFQPNADGLEVEDSANHRLKFSAVGGDVTFAIIILGRDNP